MKKASSYQNKIFSTESIFWGRGNNSEALSVLDITKTCYPFKHTIKKFLQEDSILDVWLGSEYASGKYTFSQIIINLTLWTLATGWINLKNNLQPDLPTSKNWNKENQDKNYPKQGKIVVKREKSGKTGRFNIEIYMPIFSSPRHLMFFIEG